MADESAVAVETAPVTPAPEPSWRDTLPEDLRGEKSLADFKDVASLAKGFVDTKRMVGGKLEGYVKVPGAQATPEEQAAYRKALGVPDGPEGYQIKRPEVALEGNWDDATEQGFLAAMHAAGAPGPVVQAALDYYASVQKAQLALYAQEANAVRAELRSEWGPNYDAKLGWANRAITRYGGSELEAALTDAQHPLHAASRHPLMVKAWAAVAEDLVESGTMSPDGYALLSPDEARAQAAGLRKELAALPDGHPRRAEIVDRIVSVTRAAARAR